MEPERGRPLIRYGFSVVCVAVALGAALATVHYGIHNQEAPLFEMAIAIVTWSAGVGPSMLAVGLSMACFDYFFLEPIYSFTLSPADLPYFLIFSGWAAVVACFVGIRHRIETNLRLARDQLQVRTVELESALAEMQTCSYSVADDLRTPLWAIDGFSRILLEDHAEKLDAEGKRLLGVVRDSTLKLSRFIDDLLAFSRVSRVAIKTTRVDMQALVRATLAGLQSATAQPHLAIEIGTLPPAHGDPTALGLVWTNLISNALKFTATKPDRRIEIGARAGDAETVYYVRDDGVGFDTQYAAKLFGVFQRLHGAEFPGTGMGLALVKRIVARHGGRVWAEGRLNDGAVFYFSLPNSCHGIDGAFSFLGNMP